MTQLTIHPKYLRALRLFTSTDETRHALCGVRVESTEKHTKLIATDGRILAIAKVDAVPPTKIAATIPNRLLDLFEGVWPRRHSVWSEAVIQCSEDRITISHEELMASMPPVDGAAFPNIRQVLPSGEPKPLSQICLSGDYVSRICRASEILGGPEVPGCVLRGIDELQPVEIRINNLNDLYVLLMPMRLSDTTGPLLPVERFAWLKE